MQAGFDPLELPLDRFLNWAWRMLTRNMDEKRLAQFNMDLHRPIPGITPSETIGPWSDDAMAESFMALAGQLGQTIGGRVSDRAKGGD